MYEAAAFQVPLTTGELFLNCLSVWTHMWVCVYAVVAMFWVFAEMYRDTEHCTTSTNTTTTTTNTRKNAHCFCCKYRTLW